MIDNITIATGPLHSSHFLNGFPALKVEHLHCDTVTQLLIGVNEVPEGGRGWRSGRERVEEWEGEGGAVGGRGWRNERKRVEE